MFLWVSACGMIRHLWFHLFMCICSGLCLLAGLDLDVCACVCICACEGLCISLPMSVFADVYGKMSFCTQWNHCLPILKFSGVIVQVPGLQWYVAVQDPGVMQVNRILCTGGRSWSSWAGLAAGSHGPPLKRICCRGRLPGTSAGMRRWRWRREGSEGELVVWAALHI